MPLEISQALEKEIAALPKRHPGRMTLYRARDLLKKGGYTVSIATICRVWQRYGVTPRAAPRFAKANSLRVPLFRLLASTHPRELGLEMEGWSLRRFQHYLQIMGLVNSVSARTIGRFLDREEIERPSALWPSILAGREQETANSTTIE